MPYPKFNFSRSLSGEYRDLLWHVFFVERGRGFSLAEHFPGLVEGRQVFWCATLSENGEVLAGLVVKQQTADALQGIAVIGLVCVHSARRGQGLSTILLERTLAQLDAMGFASAVLWTGKPSVYAKLGFELDDPASFGTVSNLPRRNLRLQMQVWPDEAERSGSNRGLPPYALHAQRISTIDTAASAVIVFDAAGAALAEWSGEDGALLGLLQSAMPSRWRLNSLQGDDLPALLATAGAQVDLAPAQLQMWKALSNGAVTERPRLRLLDRI